ncbi:MAG: V-type ATP synthase subunit F [Thermoplasmatota archaeon]
MKMGVCAAVSEDVALGLNLAGVEEILVWEAGMAVGDLKKWYRSMRKMDIGVMILSQECGEVLHQELFEKRAQGIMMPVTVMIPGEGEDKRARDLIKRAVGMDVGRTEEGR